MGTYSTLRVNDHEGQVKLWDSEEAPTYSQGAIVPMHGTHKTYSIAMREGGFVNIIDRKLVSWTESPEQKPIYDKWGDEYTSDENNSGLLGEKYTF